MRARNRKVEKRELRGEKSGLPLQLIQRTNHGLGGGRGGDSSFLEGSPSFTQLRSALCAVCRSFYFPQLWRQKFSSCSMNARCWFSPNSGEVRSVRLSGVRIWCRNADKWNSEPVYGVEFTTLEQSSVGKPEKRDLTHFTFLGEGGEEAGGEAFGETAPERGAKRLSSLRGCGFPRGLGDGRLSWM